MGTQVESTYSSKLQSYRIAISVILTCFGSHPKIYVSRFSKAHIRIKAVNLKNKMSAQQHLNSPPPQNTTTSSTQNHFNTSPQHQIISTKHTTTSTHHHNTTPSLTTQKKGKYQKPSGFHIPLLQFSICFLYGFAIFLLYESPFIIIIITIIIPIIIIIIIIIRNRFKPL